MAPPTSLSFAVERRFDEGLSELVWARLSDVESIPNYWHGHRELKVLDKRAGAVLVQVRFAFPGPMNRGRAEISVDPARREVVVHYMEGPFTGVAKNSVDGGVIKSVWNIRLSPLLIPLKSWILRHFREGAERALERLTTP